MIDKLSGTLTTTGSGGTRHTFRYIREKGSCLGSTCRETAKKVPRLTAYSYTVYSDLNEEFSFDVVDEGKWMRVDSISNNNSPGVSGKGIAQSLIVLVYGQFGKPVVSSSNIAEQHFLPGTDIPQSQIRCPAADEAWETMIRWMDAIKDDKTDRYYYNPCGSLST